MVENEEVKGFKSPNYNYLFNKKDGMFARWGVTSEDDPNLSPFGPEICDMEISTICNGLGTPCKFCYKTNTKVGENMSLDTFKKIFKKLPKTLTQIAFGIGDIDSNPDLWDIMSHAKNKGIIPNVTINGYNLTDVYAEKLVNTCGAVAVSRYHPKDVCYDAVKKLTEKGLEQVNIHMLVSEETYKDCLELIDDVKEDKRLAKLRSVVFLSLKPVGKRNSNTKLPQDKFKTLINKAFEKGISFGFDSCSAPKFLDSITNRPDKKYLEMCAEPCESFLFSIYINHEGKVTPCSFLESSEYQPIDILTTDDFLKDVWNSKTAISFRKALLKTEKGQQCRSCPSYNI